METSKLKKFAQYARRNLMEQVASKLGLVLENDSQARRELPQAVSELEKKISSIGQDQVIEQAAYTWFNRFCALRFMDVNSYNRIGVISPVEGQFQPEILAEAKAGHIDEGIVNESTRKKVYGLLDGSLKSRDAQSEAYRLLIVAVCNDYHRIMPYLFERIEDYTELLMPDDLLSGNSILAYTREAMTPEACSSVEAIGWLYQFYISEKKDQVFEGLKKNKKITPDNIPAATQLFTPHWIVRYLVENSLGRLWLLNNPDSKVIEHMDYYIKPVEEETDFLKIQSPEEINICDPACGSGHMLTYAYDLLYLIYLDAGYDPSDIPEKILTHNLYGIEIDERAAELAAFALSMKAIKGNPLDDGNSRRRFFRNPIKPNICHLQKIAFADEELDNYIDYVGRDLFTADLRTTLKEFEEADNFGSLIQPTLKSPEDALAAMEAKDVSGQLFLAETHKSVLQVLKQADYLSQKYHVVVANPPYMGGKGMNLRLSKWIKDIYSNVKADLYACFIERNLKLGMDYSFVGMIAMQSWMFQSSFEKLRIGIVKQKTISSLVHLGTRAFDSIGGEVVSTAAFVLENIYKSNYPSVYIKVTDGKSESQKEEILLNVIQGEEAYLNRKYITSSSKLNKIFGAPLAYWISDNLRGLFSSDIKLSDIGRPRQGLASTNNDLFYRFWHEISHGVIGFEIKSRKEALEKGNKWFPLNKGGAFRKWYGNNDYVINFEHDGKTICDYIDNTPGARVGSNGRVINREFYYKPGITYSDLTTGGFGARYFAEGFIFDTTGPSIFDEHGFGTYKLLTYVNTPVFQSMLDTVCSGLHYSNGVLANLPVHYPDKEHDKLDHNVRRLVAYSKADWDSQEVSWGFSTNPLINIKRQHVAPIKEVYEELVNSQYLQIKEVKGVEEENNSIYVNEYGLVNELNSEVPLSEITLTCNPHYRYGGNKTEAELEALLLADTLREFISYAVGCMFGRYSLDEGGLIIANQGEMLEDYLQRIPQPSFGPDDDNVIPLIDFEGDWFEDDISERFKEFLKITFGEEYLVENLAFIEDAIGKDIKKFFLKDFYTDHVKRYKKRPIYWLFSSPKGSFNALIYMHRYRPDTVSVVLNDYLREFRTKLTARKESYEQVELSASASQREKTTAIKAVAKINNVIDEVNEYERDVLYPLAGKNIEIDLDDGVKHNYPLFGKALKKVAGLS